MRAVPAPGVARLRAGLYGRSDHAGPQTGNGRNAGNSRLGDGTGSIPVVALLGLRPVPCSARNRPCDAYGAADSAAGITG